MRNALRFIVFLNPLRHALVAFGLMLALVGTPFRAPVAAQSRTGLAHFAVTTTRPDAQREFDRGLALMYAFNPEEATFHFQAAARIDGHLAMAYWGIALAAGPNVNTEYDLSRATIGREATAQAHALGPVSAPERALIDALAKRYEATNTAQILGAETAYANAMRDVARRFPTDLTIETLCAESLMDLTPLNYWRRDKSANTYTHEIIRLLDDVLKHDPNQLAANHYLIHVYEYSATPQAAFESARRLAHMTLPAGAEHLAHMPAHIYTRLGDYDDAIASSLAAITLFRKYLGRGNSDVHNGYFHHDLQVLDYAYMMSGQWSKARATASEIADQVQDNGAAVETYLRFHRWRELLDLPAPAQAGFRWRFAHGVAAAATGNLDEARATIGWIEALHDSDPRTQIAQALLIAAVASADRHDDVAISALRSAVSLQDGIALKEPPAWFYPIRETLGARLVLAHRYTEAQRVFADDLQRNPQNPRSLFGLSQALLKTDPKRAASAAAAFQRGWHYADSGLTLADL